jgi:hypothetical protein
VGSLLAAVSLLVTGMILSVLAHLDHLDVHSTGCTQFGDIADVLSISDIWAEIMAEATKGPVRGHSDKARGDLRHWRSVYLKRTNLPPGSFG